MRVGSRDSVWSEYGATRADRRAFDVEAPERSETRADGRAREVVAQSPAQDQPVLEPLGQREVEPFWLRPSDRQEEAPFAAADASTETRAEESNPDPAEGAAKDEPVRKGLGRPLTKEQEAEVEALRQRDAEVRAHEAAHMAAAGAMGGGASFDYQVGPDGRHYAVGGEVPVRTGHASSPEEAIRNAAQLRAAALAPAQPSAQDRAVAAEAAAMEAAARAEIAARRTEESLRNAEIAMAASKSDAPPLPVDPDDPEAVEAQARAAREEMAQVSERDRMLQDLESEQRYQRGGWRHLHSDSGCGSCSSAIASYR